MTKTKLLFFFSKNNTLVLFLFCLSGEAMWLFTINNMNFRNEQQLFYLGVAFSLVLALISVFYNRLPKLVSFTIWAAALNIYSLGECIITRQVSGVVAYVISLIPATFIFTADFKKPRFYYFIMNIFTLSNLIVISILKIRQPLYNLWVGDQGHFFITSAFFSAISSSVVIFLGCALCDIKLRRLERKERFMRNSMYYSAKHDPATGLMNRSRIADVFKDCENRKLQTGTDYVISIFDIDNFKKVNDTYGHSAGDYVLKAYTKKIWDAFPEPVKVGRWGGEEFTIIFPYFSNEIIFTLENVRAQIASETLKYKNQEIKITATYGISSSRNLGTAQEVLNDADQHLNIGKQNGKNRLVVSENY